MSNIHCKHCGRQTPESHSFCIYCGCNHPIFSKWIFLYVLIVLMLLIYGGIALWIL